MSGYAIPGAEPAPAAAAPEATPAPAPAETPASEPAPATASEGMHPLAVSPEEGLFAVPQADMVQKLQKLLKLKYTAVLMYINYGDRIRSHFRDAIYEHFQEHLKEEREACYDLAMKITALGGEPDVQVSKVPSTAAFGEMAMHVMRAEKELIEKQREVLAACGENTGLKVLIENMLLADQRHLDDMRRMYIPVL